MLIFTYINLFDSVFVFCQCDYYTHFACGNWCTEKWKQLAQSDTGMEVVEPRLESKQSSCVVYCHWGQQEHSEEWHWAVLAVEFILNHSVSCLIWSWKWSLPEKYYGMLEPILLESTKGFWGWKKKSPNWCKFHILCPNFSVPFSRIFP